MTTELTRSRASISIVSRRADPENIYLARRGAVLGILTISGVSAARAEELVRDWEAMAEAAGIPRLDRTFWEGAAEWSAARAHARHR